MGNTAEAITGPRGGGGGRPDPGPGKVEAAPAGKEGAGKGEAAKAPPPSRADLYAAHETSPATILFYAVVAVSLGLGYAVRGREFMVAEEGLGYWLGIVGGSMMLLLLLYPMRKKLKAMRRLGATKHWFRVHMIFGIVGPALVLYHSNFRFGSLNSTVALTTTLVVAGSGLVGRHIYSKIHYGLFGRKMTLKELKSGVEAKKNDLAQVLGYAPRLGSRLIAFDDWALREPSGFLHSVVRFFMLGFRAAWTHITVRLALRRVLKVTSRRAGWTRRETRLRKRQAKEHISEHISRAVMVAQFNIYERLFSLWHLFHMPLFILLVGVALLHVVAVHMY